MPTLTRKARQREAAIRQQLGLSPDGVRRRNEELKRRLEEEDGTNKDGPPRKRARKIGFNDLPLDLQKGIVSYLSIDDIFKVRLAGLDTGSKEFRTFTKSTMRKRIQSLQKFLEGPEISGQLRRRNKLRLQRAPNVVIRNWATEYICPSTRSQFNIDGLAEMRNMNTLIVDPMSWSRLKSSTPSMSPLPRGLEFCTTLILVIAQRQDYVTFPKRLLIAKSLEVIDIEDCCRLTCLPEDIGIDLPRLRHLNIQGCPLITSLPHSLLQTLNVNLRTGSKLSDILKCDSNVFPIEDLEKIITTEKYPRLSKTLRLELEIQTGNAKATEV